jgi:hypothetical protein
MSAGPELSSIASALDGLTKRVAETAESLSGTERDDVAAALFEVERAMQGAHRRLEKVVSGLL